jgi:Family of unknown function (DUF6491)
MRHEAIILLAVLSLMGCASSGPTSSTEERLTLYRTHSTQVDSFRINKLDGPLSRWSRLGDQALVVWGSSNEPYLLELPQECSGLATARSIGLTNSTGLVTPGTDSVRLMGVSRAGGATSCRIGSARRIDMASVDKAREQTRDASPAP